MTESSRRDLFDAFSDEVRRLHITWVLWRRLFSREPEGGEDPVSVVQAGNEAYRVMGETSELFFRYARGHMLQAVVLALSRLCDPNEMPGRSNLTLERIFEATCFGNRDQLRRHAQHAMHRAQAIIRDKNGIAGLRNRRIAHLDLDTALGTVSASNPAIEGIRLAVAWVVEVEHRLRICWNERPFSYASADSRAPHSEEVAWKAEVDRLVDVLHRGSTT